MQRTGRHNPADAGAGGRNAVRRGWLMTRKSAKRDKEKELEYGSMRGDVTSIVEAGRRSALRTINPAVLNS